MSQWNKSRWQDQHVIIIPPSVPFTIMKGVLIPCVLKKVEYRSWWLRGPGVYIWPITEIDFIVFSVRGEWDQSAAIYLIRKLILARDIAGWRSALMCNPIAWAIFNHNYPKMTIFQTSKAIFSYIFWATIQKLSGYVLKFWFRPLNRNYEFLKFSSPKQSSKKFDQKLLKIHNFGWKI